MTRWLRDAHNLKINCVEFDYYERDDAEMFVPTIIGADETQEIKEREASPKQKKYRRFFGEVLERFKEELPGVTSRSAGSDSWLTIPAGHSDVEFVWHFKGDPGVKEFHVVMNFQFDDSARNKEMLETMLAAIEDRSLDVPEEIHSEGYGHQWVHSALRQTRGRTAGRRPKGRGTEDVGGQPDGRVPRTADAGFGRRAAIGVSKGSVPSTYTLYIGTKGCVGARRCSKISNPHGRGS